MAHGRCVPLLAGKMKQKAKADIVGLKAYERVARSGLNRRARVHEVSSETDDQDMRGLCRRLSHECE
jgi:hypothetical protein